LFRLSDVNILAVHTVGRKSIKGGIGLYRLRIRHPLVMNENDDLAKQQEMLLKKLEQITLEHRDLDEVIEDMVLNPSCDMIKLQRLKKRKLAIKDEIRQLHQRLLPDIIA